MKFFGAVIVSVALVAGLAGCSLTINEPPPDTPTPTTAATTGPVATVKDSAVAAAAAKAIKNAESYSTTPYTTCGVGSSPLAVGQKFSCAMTDPQNDVTYIIPVTITSVDGTEYNIHIGDGTPEKG